MVLTQWPPWFGFAAGSMMVDLRPHCCIASAAAQPDGGRCCLQPAADTHLSLTDIHISYLFYKKNELNKNMKHVIDIHL